MVLEVVPESKRVRSKCSWSYEQLQYPAIRDVTLTLQTSFLTSVLHLDRLIDKISTPVPVLILSWACRSAQVAVVPNKNFLSRPCGSNVVE